jgi:aspartate/methionine/tyrosine aminotransferase
MIIEKSHRLNEVKEYYFSTKLKEISALIKDGKPIINLGIGSPDLAPPKEVINAISKAVLEKKNHSYQSYQGLLEFRNAIANFYKTHYKVTLNPDNEILPLMGSKEGIMHISMAFLNEGDEVLIPNPGYPTYTSVTNLVKAKPVYYNLKEENNWQPNFLEIERLDLSKVKLMWINYPHMPTGATATNKMFDDIIAFAKRHNILIINDNPYSFVLNDYPRSILKYKDAKDVCLELNSLSKTFNMSGWRVGMVLGDSKYLNDILKVKSNMDSGMFYGIQKGAIEALKCSEFWYISLRSVYLQRRELIWKLADALSCTYDKDAAGLFVWAKLPDLVKSEEFIDVILKEHSIFIAPGTVFGSNGEGYIRFSLCASVEEIEEAITRVI